MPAELGVRRDPPPGDSHCFDAIRQHRSEKSVPAAQAKLVLIMSVGSAAQTAEELLLSVAKT